MRVAGGTIAGLGGKTAARPVDCTWSRRGKARRPGRAVGFDGRRQRQHRSDPHADAATRL